MAVKDLRVGIGISLGLSLNGGRDEAQGEYESKHFHLVVLTGGGVDGLENFPPASVFSAEGAEAICDWWLDAETFIVVDDDQCSAWCNTL